MKLYYGLPTEGAGGFRTARWNLVFLEAQRAQSQAPDSLVALPQVDEEIQALSETLIASEDP